MTGLDLGRYEPGSARVILGEAKLNIDDLSSPDVDVWFINIRDTLAETALPDMVWNNLSLTNGTFNDGAGGQDGTISGAFYGPRQQEDRRRIRPQQHFGRVRSEARLGLVDKSQEGYLRFGAGTSGLFISHRRGPLLSFHRHRRSVSVGQPNFAAIEHIAAHCEPCSPRCSKTSWTARSRTSAG